MQCFRLTREPHANLSDTGGLHETGRWHARLAVIVYTSSSRALALLEEQRSLALIAPSIMVPQEPNIVRNPRHPAISDASLSIERDPRGISACFAYKPRFRRATLPALNPKAA